MYNLLKSSHARKFAEALWGKGGTTAYRTNRKGVFYYSCAGHGGYVLDKRALSTTELEAINKYKTMPNNWRCDVYQHNGKTVFFHPARQRRARVSFQSVFTQFDVLTFEEDCDWAVLESCTDIRAACDISEERREVIRQKTLETWFKDKVSN